MSRGEYFDQVAGRWDEMRRSFFSDAVRESVYAAACVQSGKTAADIGAGSGFITEGLLRRGLRVLAVDPSRPMLVEMKSKFAGLGAVGLLRGEADRLSLSDASVDYVFANMLLHHVESPGEAVKEMARILKPGGTLVITDLDEHRFEFLRTEHHDRWMGFRREAMARWLSESGLTNVAVDCAGEDCCARSSGGGDVAQVSIFVASGQK